MSAATWFHIELLSVGSLLMGLNQYVMLLTHHHCVISFLHPNPSGYNQFQFWTKNSHRYNTSEWTIVTNKNHPGTMAAYTIMTVKELWRTKAIWVFHVLNVLVMGAKKNDVTQLLLTKAFMCSFPWIMEIHNVGLNSFPLLPSLKEYEHMTHSNSWGGRNYLSIHN